jgi:hypothetical protein
MLHFKYCRSSTLPLILHLNSTCSILGLTDEHALLREEGTPIYIMMYSVIASFAPPFFGSDRGKGTTDSKIMERSSSESNRNHTHNKELFYDRQQQQLAVLNGSLMVATLTF